MFSGEAQLQVLKHRRTHKQNPNVTRILLWDLRRWQPPPAGPAEQQGPGDSKDPKNEWTLLKRLHACCCTTLQLRFCRRLGENCYSRLLTSTNSHHVEETTWTCGNSPAFEMTTSSWGFSTVLMNGVVLWHDTHKEEAACLLALLGHGEPELLRESSWRGAGCVKGFVPPHRQFL